MSPECHPADPHFGSRTGTMHVMTSKDVLTSNDMFSAPNHICDPRPLPELANRLQFRRVLAEEHRVR